MRLSRSDIKLIYLAIRILGDSLPYEEDTENIIDKCRAVLSADEVLEIDEEADRLIHESDAMHELARTVLKQQ